MATIKIYRAIESSSFIYFETYIKPMKQAINKLANNRPIILCFLVMLTLFFIKLMPYGCKIIKYIVLFDQIP